MQEVNSPKPIYMKWLSTLPKDTNSRVWHRLYRCQGIQHCEHAHPDIYTPSPEYDSVDPKIFVETRKKGAVPVYGKVSQ